MELSQTHKANSPCHSYSKSQYITIMNTYDKKPSLFNCCMPFEKPICMHCLDDTQTVLIITSRCHKCEDSTLYTLYFGDAVHGCTCYSHRNRPIFQCLKYAWSNTKSMKNDNWCHAMKFRFTPHPHCGIELVHREASSWS